MRKFLVFLAAASMTLSGSWAAAENGQPAGGEKPAEAAQPVPGPGALEVEDHFFDSEGVKLRYIDIGEGEPLILLHGFTANVERQWGQLLGPLSEVYRVIALDERGHGKSDKPTETGSYGMNMIEDVIRLMDHLGIEKAHIAGYSMGAGITARLIADHPERFASAVLGGAGAPNFDQSELGTQLEQLAVALEEQASIRPLIEFLQPEGQPAMSEEQMKGIDTLLMSTNDPKALAAVVRGFQDYSMNEEQIAEIEVPTLAIVGDMDPLKSQIDAMEPLVEDLEVVVVPGANHMTAFMRPEFLEAMKGHLAEHSMGERGQDQAAEEVDAEEAA